MRQTVDIFYPCKSPEDLLIRLIWKAVQTDCKDEVETILPEGTAEIIFNLTAGAFYFRDSEATAFKLPLCFINGINTEPYNLLKEGDQIFVGIQLHACALKYLFNMPASEFTNKVSNGFFICKSLIELFENIYVNNSFEAQVDFILTWLLHQIKRVKVQAAPCRIFNLFNNSENENLSFASICKKHNVFDRHLRLLSSAFIGLKTEDFILYKKYLKSLYTLHDRTFSLTSIAYESGFYDQSHFIREFKSFTHLTPGEYRKQMSDTPGHLYFAKSTNMSV